MDEMNNVAGLIDELSQLLVENPILLFPCAADPVLRIGLLLMALEGEEVDFNFVE